MERHRETGGWRPGHTGGAQRGRDTGPWTRPAHLGRPRLRAPWGACGLWPGWRVGWTVPSPKPRPRYHVSPLEARLRPDASTRRHTHTWAHMPATGTLTNTFWKDSLKGTQGRTHHRSGQGPGSRPEALVCTMDRPLLPRILNICSALTNEVCSAVSGAQKTWMRTSGGLRPLTGRGTWESGHL